MVEVGVVEHRNQGRAQRYLVPSQPREEYYVINESPYFSLTLHNMQVLIKKKGSDLKFRSSHSVLEMYS